MRMRWRMDVAAVVVWIGLTGFSTRAGEGDVGEARDVARDVKGTQAQMWPAAAWSEKANGWLVAWREGDMTSENTDIWCARVMADGTTPDSGGILVCGARDVQDRPMVVSDGKDFLVVWEDMRNGKDWDIYAARISADGKVLDPEGIPVAGGAHNQCRPAAAFCEGNYTVAFMAYTTKGAGAAGTPGTGYVVRSVRLASDGKVLDGDPTAVSDTEPKMHTWQPSAAAGAGGVLIPAYQRDFGEDYKAVILSAGWVAMPGGKVETPMAKVVSSAPAPYKNLPSGSRTSHQPPAVAWTGKNFLVGTPKGAGKTAYAPDAVAVFRLDARGKDLGNPEIVDAFGGNRMFKQNPRVSLAFDGERALLTQDSVRATDKRGLGLARVQVRGCFLSPEGKPLEGKSLLIAGDESLKKDCMQGFAAAGARGSFLAVWSEARGADDVKVAARVLKTTP